MATYNYSEWKNRKNTSNQNNTSNQSSVSFFSLKNDKDEAIVRFMYSTVDDIQIVDLHEVMIGGKRKKIKCLRESYKAPFSDCPLCEDKNNLKARFFVKMLHYTRDDDGNPICKAVIWERSYTFADELAALIEEWGDLTESVFKIKRFGNASDKGGVSYKIVPCNPKVYTSENCPIKKELFDGFDVVGRIVLVRSCEQMLDIIGENNVSTPKAIESEAKPTIKETVSQETSPKQEPKVEPTVNTGLTVEEEPPFDYSPRATAPTQPITEEVPQQRRVIAEDSLPFDLDFTSKPRRSY